MKHHQANDERIERLIAATHAPAHPAVLARARARIAAMAAPSEPAWVRWLARPVALAASGGLLALSLAAGGWLLRGVTSTAPESASSRESVGISDLLGDDGSYGLVFEGGSAEQTTIVDSGSIR
ncbi:MAG: hypothetical protein ABIU54_13285 [Candidatus Eisenbacteria bacterium]